MAESIRTRLKSRLAQLRESRKILAKRSAAVNKAKDQQTKARKNLESAVKHHKPKHLIDQLQHKLEVAHWELDKAVLGKEEYEKRTKRLEKKVKYLKDHVPPPAPRVASGGVSTPNAPWNPSHRQISNSIIPWLEKTWAANVRFTVTSGYRSPQYQCEICRSMCGNCTGGCPGRCAPMGQSNHQQYGPGKGAVDVTNYYAFKAAQYRIGSPLRNYLGGQDPVHFSFTGR